MGARRRRPGARQQSLARGNQLLDRARARGGHVAGSAAPPRSDALVVGAGIGGLAAALALSRTGAHARVFEREQRARGGALSLWSNATAALDRLGVGESVRRSATPFDTLELRTSTDRHVLSVSLDRLGRRLGAPSIGIDNVVLQQILADALPTEIVRGAALDEFVEEPDGIRARFEDGREERGDILIGADGARSVVRAQLGAAPLRYAGYRYFCATTADAVGIPHGRLMHWFSPTTLAVAYDIGEGRTAWTLIVRAPEGDGDESPLVWLDGWPDSLVAMIERTPTGEIESASHHVATLPGEPWGRGRVTLVGDAAHPFTLFGANGACQTLEDALALARALAVDSPPQGLRNYESTRGPRVAKTIAGAEQLRSILGLRGRVARLVRDRAMLPVFSLVAPFGFARQQFDEGVLAPLPADVMIGP